MTLKLKNILHHKIFRQQYIYEIPKEKNNDEFKMQKYTAINEISFCKNKINKD